MFLLSPGVAQRTPNNNNNNITVTYNPPTTSGAAEPLINKTERGKIDEARVQVVNILSVYNARYLHL